MNVLRRLSIVTMAAILAASAVPVFAQDTRDTRPRPERPVVEHDNGGSDAADVEPDARKPKSSAGLSCVIDYSPGGSYAYAVNNTGKDVPKGTVVVWYAQPGNIQEYYQLGWDWKAGDILWIPVKDDDKVQEISFCAIKISTLRPKPEEPEEGTEPIRDQGDGNDNPFQEPKRNVPAKPDFVKAELECTPYTAESFDGYFMKFVGPKPDGLPPGTVIYWQTLPDGKIHQMTFTNGLPPGKVVVAQSWEGDLPIGEQGQLPECQVWAM